MVQEETLFKDVSYLELCWPFCSGEQNHLYNFGRGHHEEYFFEIILNLDQWFRRCCSRDAVMPTTFFTVEGAYCFGLIRPSVKKNMFGFLKFINGFLIKK